MSRLTWFPFYVEDFRVSTLELKTDEIGVYFTMLVLCYARGGPLPGDDAELKFMLQRQIADFHGHTYNRIVKKLLSKYFYRDEAGNWRQKRVELELKRARDLTEKQRDRVTKRWVNETEIEGKIATNAPQTSRKRSANVSQNGEQALKNNEFTHTNNNTIHNSILSSNEDKNTREARLLSVRQSFARFWTAWPHKVGKPAAERAFGKVADEIDAIVAGVERYIRDKPPDRPWLNPATFLNQRRWEDAPAESSVIRMQPKERDLRNVPDALLSADDYWKKRRQQREWA